MNPPGSIDRRHWLQFAGALSVVAAGHSLERQAPCGQCLAAEPSRKLLLRKTLKIGMVKQGKTMMEKFRVAKEAGFEGIELHAPDYDIAEVRNAIAETGLRVDGTVVHNHWQVRHTDPDPAVRAKALATLKEAIQSTHAVGGHTALLVLGHGMDGDEKTIWERSMANLREAIPVAADYGVYIAIENVWNHFLYDHEGKPEQTAEKFARYVDEADSPWVGMQFDIGNHWKYGDPGAWIRTLGKRIVKLDIKGFSRALDKFTPIGEDDLPWDNVRQSLMEIGFQGWVAAEVAGGDLAELKKVAAAIDRVLQIA